MPTPSFQFSWTSPISERHADMFANRTRLWRAAAGVSLLANLAACTTNLAGVQVQRVAPGEAAVQLGPPASGDPATYATSGILNGSATLSKNTTTAEASANRVANSLAVSATDNGATAAIGNEQYSSTTVNAIASSSSYKLELEGSNAASGGATYAASGTGVFMHLRWLSLLQPIGDGA